VTGGVRILDHERPVVGMVHLLPLPGSPRYEGSRDVVRSAALRDAEVLAEGGVQGILVENYGDSPFFPDRVPAYVVAEMTALASEIGRATGLPLGINVLRNDGSAAVAVAHAAGARFVRINVFCGVRATDQGLISGKAHEVLRERSLLGAESIRILADVDVKHSRPVGELDLGDEVRDCLERGGADGVIVSGSRTGSPVDLDRVRLAKECARGAPVWIGSGVSPQNVEQILVEADGLIVGTAFKVDGVTSNPVDPERVRSLIARIG
jgi:membrane complex biogenesis BtpA family protein